MLIGSSGTDGKSRDSRASVVFSPDTITEKEGGRRLSRVRKASMAGSSPVRRASMAGSSPVPRASKRGSVLGAVVPSANSSPYQAARSSLMFGNGMRQSIMMDNEGAE